MGGDLHIYSITDLYSLRYREPPLTKINILWYKVQFSDNCRVKAENLKKNHESLYLDQASYSFVFQPR